MVTSSHLVVVFDFDAAAALRALTQPGASYAGVGLWRPETALARTIREAIVADPVAWKKAAHSKSFTNRFTPDGDSLARPPQGFDPDHPLIDDLKRKDFIAGTRIEDTVVLSERLLAEYTAMCKAAAPFVAFLTTAIGLEF